VLAFSLFQIFPLDVVRVIGGVEGEAVGGVEIEAGVALGAT
jgi:hypothetical protein